MIRPVLGLAAFGVATVVAWQLVWGFVLPLVFGVLAVLLKVLFWGLIIAAAIWVFRKLSRGSESTA
jgi:hypothetical protein